jgi:hypothetical protein
MAIIAISRGTFSGGQGLAELLAERLGYECVSREDLVESATWYGVSPVSLAAAREMRPDLWRGVHAEQVAYLMSIRAALCDRAASGNLVYSGHAAHLPRGAELWVVADGDVVTITPSASSEGVKDDALAVARQVRGVREARWKASASPVAARPQ